MYHRGVNIRTKFGETEQRLYKACVNATTVAEVNIHLDNMSAAGISLIETMHICLLSNTHLLSP